MASREWFASKPWKKNKTWQSLMTPSNDHHLSYKKVGMLDGIHELPNEALAMAEWVDPDRDRQSQGVLEAGKFTRPKLAEHDEEEAIVLESFDASRLMRLHQEYVDACNQAMPQKTSKLLVRKNAQVHGDKHVHDALFLTLDPNVKEAMVGSTTIDATIMTCDREWFQPNNDMHIEMFMEDEYPLSTKIITKGTNPYNHAEIVQMWQMICSANIGCVVSVLGHADYHRASWASLESEESRYSDGVTRVRVWVESEDAQKILPVPLLETYKALVGTLKPETAGRLYATVRKLRFKIGKRPSKTIVHVAVQNWTDMAPVLRPAETRFLNHLALLINGIADTPDAFENGHTHRQLFHCSAGCGRSMVVLSATLLCDTHHVDMLNSNLYDMMVNQKMRRLNAINCLEHYLSLDLLLRRRNDRPLLIAATYLADAMGSVTDTYKLERYRWAIVACLRDVPRATDNFAWYSRILGA